MEGWTCPRCGRCYAPFVSECAHCNAVTVGVPSTTSSPPDRCPACGGTRFETPKTGCGRFHYGAYGNWHL